MPRSRVLGTMGRASLCMVRFGEMFAVPRFSTQHLSTDIPRSQSKIAKAWNFKVKAMIVKVKSPIPKSADHM